MPPRPSRRRGPSLSADDREGTLEALIQSWGGVLADRDDCCGGADCDGCADCCRCLDCLAEGNDGYDGYARWEGDDGWPGEQGAAGLALDDDDDVADLLAFGLPDLPGQTMLAWVLTDGDEPLPALSVVDDTPSLVSDAEAAGLVVGLVKIASHFSTEPGLILAWKRRGSDAPTDEDLAWLRVAPRVCAEAGVRLWGVWLIAGNALPLRLDAPASAAPG